FVAVSRQAADTLDKYVTPAAVVGDPRDDVTDFIRTKEFKPNTMLALRVLVNDIGTEMAQFKQLAMVPHEHVRNFRNDMYLVSEALRLMQKSGKPQFAAADVTAMATIGAADGFGLPVSTTHVLSSGVAGTMLSNPSGLQFSTVRNLLLAWVLTLPAAMTLSGFLFYAFRNLFKG